MKKDVSWSIFFEDNERVADLISCIAIGETGRIKESDVTDANTKLSLLVRLRDSWLKQSKNRDIVKKVVFGATVVIADIEAQETVDYSYPLRELGYIYGEYETQARQIRRRNNRRRLNRRQGELLYGFNKTDRLNPTVVFLLYSGKEDWDGPVCLHEILNMNDIPNNLRSMVLNHKVNIINIRKLSKAQLDKFKTDVGKVFACVKYSEDRDKLEEIITNDDYYKNIDKTAIEVIAEYIHEIKILEKAEANEEGKYNMCKAIEDMMKESREEGQRIMLVAMVKDGEIKIESAARRLGITPEEFKKLL